MIAGVSGAVAALLGAFCAHGLKPHLNDYQLGIYETGATLEDNGAVISLEDAQEVLGKPRQVSVFYIQLKDFLADKLETLLIPR